MEYSNSDPKSLDPSDSLNDEPDESAETSLSDQISENIKKSSSNADEHPSKDVKYTPLMTILEDNSKKKLTYDDDITEKLIMIFGLATQLHLIHENNSTNVNITPDYIFFDENLIPYIDLEKLNTDSKKLNADNFLLIKSEYDPYFPLEVKDDNFSISNNDLKKLVDVYIFGCIFFSLISNILIDANTDFYEILEDLFSHYYIDEQLKILILTCLHEKSIRRPFFSDILYIMNSEELISKLVEDSKLDLEKFKKYQLTVANDKILPIINSDYDITKLPNVRMLKKSDFNFNTKEKKINGGNGKISIATTEIEPIQKVAYKIINKNSKNTNNKDLYREVEILSTVNHYAVQSLFGYVPETKDNKEAIVTLFQENGSLHDLIKKVNKNPDLLDFTQKYIIMYGIAAGMYYLHNIDIVHRDIKTLNIFINEHYEPIIADFGLSKKLFTKNFANTKLHNGTPAYMAPEQHDDVSNYFFSILDSKKIDVYSFSLTIYSLFSGKEPWQGVKNIGSKVIDGERPKIPEDFPKTISLLIQACWHNSPDMRPSFEIILQMIGHPIFIENLGYKLDIDRFKEYQKKVVDESFIYKNNQSTTNDDKMIHFKGIVFPSIPINKLYNENEFKIIETKRNSPFFIHQIIEKDSMKFNLFEIKDEYFFDQLVLKCLKTQIEVLLKINHPSFNLLYGIIDHPSEVTFNEDAKDIYDIFPQGDIKPPSIITPFYSKGNLLNNQHKLNITQKFIILYGIAAGMYYLHKQGMTHLNLKPGNIL